MLFVIVTGISLFDWPISVFSLNCPFGSHILLYDSAAAKVESDKVHSGSRLPKTVDESSHVMRRVVKGPFIGAISPRKLYFWFRELCRLHF